MTAAALEESAEELLERLGDIGVSCDDLTVEDVLYQAVPNRFVRVGAHLASDVATVVATGLVGVSDSDGTEAAVSAIYRSAANAGNNPTAAAARLEQGLRRLAAALDDTDAGAAGRVSVVAILNALVTYVQVGTMLAQRRSKANATGKDDDTTVAAAGEFDLRPGSDTDATPSHPSLDPPKHTSLDPAQTVRVSKQLWRVVNGVRVDDGVAKTLASSGYGGYGSAGNSSQLPSTSHAPCALSLLDAVLAAVRRALKALPSDHLLTAVALTEANKLTAPEKTMLESVNSALSEEYATRKETVQRRAWLTVQAFGQSARLVKGNCAPQITSLFSKRAGFGANGDAVGDDGDESENENDDALPVTSKVSLADAWDCRVADLARVTQRVNAEHAQTLDASVKRVRIGSVPDRGGRTEVSDRRDLDSKKHMPAFTERNPDAAKHGGGGGVGGGVSGAGNGNSGGAGGRGNNGSGNGNNGGGRGEEKGGRKGGGRGGR